MKYLSVRKSCRKSSLNIRNLNAGSFIDKWYLCRWNGDIKTTLFFFMSIVLSFILIDPVLSLKNRIDSISKIIWIQLLTTAGIYQKVNPTLSFIKADVFYCIHDFVIFYEHTWLLWRWARRVSLHLHRQIWQATYWQYRICRV